MSNLQKEDFYRNEAVLSSDSHQEPEELTIDLVELMWRLIERARLIVAASLLGAFLAGIAAVFFITPQYTATAKLYVMNSGESAINLSDLQIGSYLTADYAEVFKNWHVHEMVIQELDLPCSYKELSSSLSVSNPSNTRILYISFTSEDPHLAKLIANTYAHKAQEFIASTMDTRMPNIFEEALLPSAPSSMSKTGYVMLGFMLGFILSCTLITIDFILDDRILNSADLEKYLGLQVLGIMPVISTKGSSARKTGKKEQ